MKQTQELYFLWFSVLIRHLVGRTIPPFNDFILKHNLTELTVFSINAASMCVDTCSFEALVCL